ncbi:hypothetical protein QMK17_02670 [Rhodococcus sp. G-MC3]|uniref:hypothetical protein n=1 Tax=Rhodococcus sp. G-MC3 TaxID=3046209 RepID=UPI0024BA266D|nr:hypothetical protein [Rhodococcus sp. G-MC3]MDJ0392234.1 hypothetical protein [Rhodococcus sp. G-MC3]
MKRATAVVDRLLVLLLGIVLLGGGAFALAWHFDVPIAKDTLSRFDRAVFAGLPAQSWWEPALAGTAVAATLAAIALLIGNLSPRHTGTVQISTGEVLAVRVDLGALARGVAADLATFPGVESSRGRAIDDRGTATLAVTVSTSPHIDIDTFTRVVETAAGFVAEALEGAPVAVRVQVHASAHKRGSTGSDSNASTAKTA